MPIINLQRRLHETGRIRIGQKVESQNGKIYPAKLDTFRLTSTNEAAIKAIAAKYGGEPHIWTDAPVGTQWELLTESSTLKVLIPPEAMAFSQNYELWSGGGCVRRCNGVYQIPSEEPCVCDPENRECKPHTRLSIMLADLPGAGLWRLDTQGWNAANELGGAFELASLIAQATGRAIVPGTLRLDQRASKRPDPNDDSKVITRKFAVPVLDFDVDMNTIARESLTSNVTPIPEIETPSLADELRSIDEDVERRPRSNAAEPVASTGLKPRARGELRDDEAYFPGVNRASAEQVSSLSNALHMLEEVDKETVKQKWTERGVPQGRLGDLTPEQADLGLAIISEVVNAVDTTEFVTDVPVPSITQAQIGKIRVLVGQHGVDKADIHTFVSDIIHRQISSLKDLTKGEASKVIDQLSEVN